MKPTMQSLSGALLSIQSTSSDLLRSSRSTSATKLSGGATQDMAHSVGLELLQLCEAESVSYLDELASNTTTQDMAKSVLALLKKAWYRFKTDKYSLQGKLPEGATGA
ncbi:hypothetical protein SASPL_129790 [Salvia splendens]|uniref:Nodulin homeobox N-terminal domain-containing protein n=1 Tax=Salvia splendens TaxID=180675 RepID=A0A8X8XHU9_SALSN|nr:hypothetical protein SASPL_129790 [Salvia splendens]